MPLTPDQEARLALMRADNSASDALFRPGTYWDQMHSVMVGVFNSIGLDDVEAGLLNTYFSNTKRDDQRLYEWFLTVYYQLLKQRDRLGLLSRLEATTPGSAKYSISQNSKEIRTSTAIEIEGVRISPDFLFTLRDF